MGEVAAQTCTSTSSTTSVMAYGCDLTRVFTYEGSETDIYINYVTLVLTLITLILCTRKAGERASRYPRYAAWFWVPFTSVLFAMQLFADCSTNNVGISAVWSAYAGFVFLAWWRIQHIRAENAAVSTLAYATPVSLAMWTGVCVYYAIVEEAITTVAHLVAFGVGAGALLLFEALHKISQDSYEMMDDK
ncbi:unnamed protein product [Ectocarpus sp. 6 AP-2014]